jgi:hypothetical protein
METFFGSDMHDGSIHAAAVAIARFLKTVRLFISFGFVLERPD